MNRRSAILGAVALLAAPHGAWSQTSGGTRKVAWLTMGRVEAYQPFIAAFSEKLKELGYLEGRDFVFELRGAGLQAERLPTLARELVGFNPAVIVTGGSAAIRALRNETSSLPVVFGSADDPVAQGFIHSLPRPGGNVTGVALRAEVDEKLVELAREVLPAARRLGLLVIEGDPVTKRILERVQRAAAALGFAFASLQVNRVEDFDAAIADARLRKLEALLAPSMSLLIQNAPRLTQLAIEARLPLFGNDRRYSLVGGLLSYTSNLAELYRRAAVLVAKILKGANPGELAVEQPDRYDLVINLRTAKTLGLAIPQAVLLRATEVIE